MYNYNNNWINISNLIYSIIVLECIVGYSESAFKNSFFQRIGGVHSSYAYSIMTSASRVNCVKQCIEDNGCLMITYQERNRTCGLSDKWLNDVGVTASADVNSDVYFDTGRYMSHIYFLSAIHSVS